MSELCILIKSVHVLHKKWTPQRRKECVEELTKNRWPDMSATLMIHEPTVKEGSGVRIYRVITHTWSYTLSGVRMVFVVIDNTSETDTPAHKPLTDIYVEEWCTQREISAFVPIKADIIWDMENFHCWKIKIGHIFGCEIRIHDCDLHGVLKINVVFMDSVSMLRSIASRVVA